ncbi:MAG TPA: phosphate signaling complex protein PhoU [Candidatus Dormibacteraeota bacterium]
MTRELFERELVTLRETLLEMGSKVESQIADAATAMQKRDSQLADRVRNDDRLLNELFVRIREEALVTIARQQPVARDLRLLMGFVYIASELERIGDYAVRIARMTSTLVQLPTVPMRAEFGLMAHLAIRQVHDILDALIEMDEQVAQQVAGRDDEIDRLYHRLFEDLVHEMALADDSDQTLALTTLILIAHNLERIADRVTNVAEDIVFLETGQVVELG